MAGRRWGRERDNAGDRGSGWRGNNRVGETEGAGFTQRERETQREDRARRAGRDTAHSGRHHGAARERDRENGVVGMGRGSGWTE